MQCLDCEKEFVNRNSNAKFCDVNCRKRFERRTNKDIPEPVEVEKEGQTRTDEPTKADETRTDQPTEDALAAKDEIIFGLQCQILDLTETLSDRDYRIQVLEKKNATFVNQMNISKRQKQLLIRTDDLEEIQGYETGAL